MPVFAYTIAADQDRPSEGEGFVRAETIQAAVALVGHPDVNVYPLPADAVWPGEPGEAVWQCGWGHRFQAGCEVIGGAEDLSAL